jgi:hypothetical protein
LLTPIAGRIKLQSEATVNSDEISPAAIPSGVIWTANKIYRQRADRRLSGRYIYDERTGGRYVAAFRSRLTFLVATGGRAGTPD